MKVGVSVKIDVTKIDKARLFEGKNGAKYLDMTTFIDLDNQGQYGDNGMITQDVSKEEREQGKNGAILGNVRVFYKDGGTQQDYRGHSGSNQQNPTSQSHDPSARQPNPQGQPQDGGFDDDLDSLPF